MNSKSSSRAIPKTLGGLSNQVKMLIEAMALKYSTIYKRLKSIFRVNSTAALNNIRLALFKNILKIPT
jgi:hypothetical protein